MVDEEIQKENEEKTPEITIANIGEGVQRKTTPLIEDANLAAKRVEDATKALKEQNDRREAIEANRLVGGRSESGGTIKQHEETDEELTERFMTGKLKLLEDEDAR